MDAFSQCVEDLGTIGRMLDLPHGREIAAEMLREVSPYLLELEAIKDRDPTGAVNLISDYAEGLRVRLRVSDTKGLFPRPTKRVA